MLSKVRINTYRQMMTRGDRLNIDTMGVCSVAGFDLLHTLFYVSVVTREEE